MTFRLITTLNKGNDWITFSIVGQTAKLTGNNRQPQYMHRDDARRVYAELLQGGWVKRPSPTNPLPLKRWTGD